MIQVKFDGQKKTDKIVKKEPPIKLFSYLLLLVKSSLLWTYAEQTDLFFTCVEKAKTRQS